MTTFNKVLPATLLLKKKISQRLNDIEVGLYQSDDLNQTIVITSQMLLKTESIGDTLKSISENNCIQSLVFEDETSLNIDKTCADLVLEYIEKNPNEDICSSQKTFLYVLSKAIENKESVQG